MVSKILVTHPENATFLRKEIEKFYQSADIHMPFGFKIMPNSNMPKYREDKTKVIWHDTKFVKYSNGPSKGSKMTYWQYVEMCVYWGWAEFYKERLFYECSHEFIKPPIDCLKDRTSDFTRTLMGDNDEIITNRYEPKFYI